MNVFNALNDRCDKSSKVLFICEGRTHERLNTWVKESGRAKEEQKTFRFCAVFTFFCGGANK